ncbi:suppressor protein of bem1/bed5 double mutants-like [Tribolium madens]|uniref:suppressor protein of bem1/bed5 double mutants-like n=1 Tax=Tribolium madens TaxID=41895 RepID=UPI001CF72408|nr:suppressor protein of bem1/bed5 double mutants-like [Tribolium madens]
MELETNDIINCYLSVIEIVEQLVSYFTSAETKHYPLVHQELVNCCQKIDIIITLETNNANFLVALFQQKHQLTFLLEISEKLIQAEIRLDINRTINEKPLQEDKVDKITTIIKNSIENPKVNGLSEIIGLYDIKKTLKSLVILPKTQPQLFYNRRICNSILLYGPPGTGKTRLAHALASEAAATFYSISAGDVLSHYVGQTEKTIKALFQHLKKSSDFSILFIDEIDAFCRKRSGSEQEHTRRIKTELMCQMSNIEDCKNMFIVCATNCPWDLDCAILRRFQKRIYVPLPSQFERLEFFQFFTRNIRFEGSYVDWTELLEKTEGYSGSDLNDLIQTALNIPLNELEDTKIWKCSDDGFYEPIMGEQDFSKVVCSELQDLPSNSVKARNVQMNDFFIASDSVKCTVSQSDVKKYENFIGI